MPYLHPPELTDLRAALGLARGDADRLAEHLDDTADPVAAVRALIQLAAAAPDALGAVLADEQGRAALLAVVGLSRSLARFLTTHPDELGALCSPRVVPEWYELVDEALTLPARDDPAAALRTFRRRRFLQIATADLLGVAGLPLVGAALSDLADACLTASLAIAGADGDLAVIAMGKFGGSELNYSSDVDVLFLAGDPGIGGAVAQRVIQLMSEQTSEGIVWRVDTDLRPEGRDGPLVRSPESYLTYYRRWADTWELQALIKRRPCAGNVQMATDLCDELEALVYPSERPPDALDGLRAMKARAEAQVARAGLSEREVKLGPGGIRDVEFAVQLLQLVHGHGDPAQRSANTLTALQRLAGNGYIDRSDADILSAAYVRLRTVEHRLQLRDEAQVHTLPADPAELEVIARAVGHRPDADATAADHFVSTYAQQVATVRSVHERLFYRPLLEAFMSGDTRHRLSSEAAEERLQAFGFANAARTRTALNSLTSGLSRRSTLMTQMLPLLLGWLTDAPDPDLGLLMLERLAEKPHRAEALTGVFRESPLAAQRLCTVIATSRLLAETLEHEPDLIGLLADDRRLNSTRTRDDLLDEARSRLSWRQDPASRVVALRRFARRERARIALRDVLGIADRATVGRELTLLAEACLEGALETSERQRQLPPIALIGMGSFGGAELSYGSDLDLLIVYADGGEFQEVERLAEGLLATLAAPSPEGPAFELDLDLRPEGKQGNLARPLGGYLTYWDRWADPWEFQTLTRARPVAGDPELGQAFVDAAAGFVYRSPMPPAWEGATRRMKARIEKERLPRRTDPELHLKLGAGGLVDVEFAVQLLLLRHGAAFPDIRRPTIAAALGALAAAGLLDAETGERLDVAYAFTSRLRDRLTLLGARDPDVLPSDVEMLSRLARSLGYERHPAPDLREDYRRVTRRARQAAEQVLYSD